MSKVFCLFLSVVVLALKVTSEIANDVDYYSGSGLNLILGVPHGGDRKPIEIPDRDFGCWEDEDEKCSWDHDCSPKNQVKCKAVVENDVFTIELVQNIRKFLCTHFNGACPALVINLLNRKKLDANREINEATFNVPAAVATFTEFHRRIAQEKNKIDRSIGGLYIDIHGHGHEKQRAELGYLLKAEQLDGDLKEAINHSSIRNLATNFYNDVNKLERLIKGNESFGWFMEKHGYAAVPSPKDPSPGTGSFFNGGYNTLTYGSKNGGYMDAIQLESCRSARESKNITIYSCAVSLAMRDFMCLHYYKNLEKANEAIRKGCMEPATHCRLHTSGNEALSVNFLLLSAGVVFLYLKNVSRI